MLRSALLDISFSQSPSLGHNRRSSHRAGLIRSHTSLRIRFFLIWYVIMIKNTKSSINTTSTPTKLILLAELSL